MTPRNLTRWAAAALVVSGPAFADTADPFDLSLEELMSMEVFSVSKRAESQFTVAAAVHVITAEDIRRSGATSLGEALRGVPGLQVARVHNNAWAISGRGFNGVFANKLLVLVDGRTVYNPSFSGVFWDAQEFVMADIERHGAAISETQVRGKIDDLEDVAFDQVCDEEGIEH